MINEMLNRYNIITKEDQALALREVMQEITLSGLYRGGFFDKAAFYGGTCLRIFYQLPRYSEDLDFSLLQPDNEFSLEPYFKAIKREFEGNGIEIEITQKKKSIDTAIESAFLKNTTKVFDLSLAGEQPVKIKFEVDTQPPLGFMTEEKLLIEPFSFHVKCFQVSDLFAGKIHALMFRQWKNRVKGRDWFDFEWYVRKRVPFNLEHFNIRALQSESIREPLGKEKFLLQLKEKIERTDLQGAKQDVERFIRDKGVLDIWSKDYFLALSEKLVFKE